MKIAYGLPLVSSLIAISTAHAQVPDYNAILGRLRPPAPQASNIPTMTIKIYNDDPDHYVFPVYTTGQHTLTKERGDIWLQTWFKNTKAQILSGNFDYKSSHSFRFYLTDQSGLLPLGIAPKKSVELQIPLYTQLVANPSPAADNQYADWWNGATIQMFYSNSAVPPAVLVADLLRNTKNPLNSDAPVKVFPSCSTGCQRLKFVWDTIDIPKNRPAQLIEFTLGARVELCEIFNKCKDGDRPNDLDLENVDFDVSYVNYVFGPAAMGPYKNNQVGYVGTPDGVAAFEGKRDKWLKDFAGWPRFVNDQKVAINKVPSPLEIFAKIRPDILPPPDLEPLPDKNHGGDPSKWPKPESLWAPIRALYTNWTTWAGDFKSPGQCTAGDGKQFCDAIISVKTLMLANYDEYKKLFGPNKPCGNGTPIALSDQLLVSHVYGWAPFTENGCPSNINLLQDTPGYKENFYQKYAVVKDQYDRLNYGFLPNQKYVFNPYVSFVHGADYMNIKNAYAYSVDDAVGNVQAEGQGIIIDVGSTVHLENELPASEPITINYGLNTGNVVFTKYSVCNDQHWKPTRSFFNSFVINANDPGKCPVFFEDDKNPAQRYTFKVVADPSTFVEATDPAKQIWTPDTAKPIACTGNDAGAPYSPSSHEWCCYLTATAGIKAFQVLEPLSAHASKHYFVITDGPKISRNVLNPNDKLCSQGAWPY